MLPPTSPMRNGFTDNLELEELFSHGTFGSLVTTKRPIEILYQDEFYRS